MYARPSRPSRRQRASDVHVFGAPIAGWIRNRSLTQPGEGAQGAEVLENFFPTATTARLRRGSVLHQTVGDGDKTVESIFSYQSGVTRRLFAATEDGIYDVTSGAGTPALVYPATSGYWSVVQFATTGGEFLVGVNGVDNGFIFNGEDFYENVPGGIYLASYTTMPALTLQVDESFTLDDDPAVGATVYRIGPEANRIYLKDMVGGDWPNTVGFKVVTGDLGGTGALSGNFTPGEFQPPNLTPGFGFDGSVTLADMSMVWVYKNRLFFVEKDSLNAWYIEDLDSIGGEAKRFPLGGVMSLGGSLLFGHGWSLDSGAAGGLSEQCVFVSTEGEIAVYQGGDPGEADDWGRVGVYRAGRPLGNRAFIRNGGDLIIATSIGFVPLTAAVQRDVASLSPSAISFSIEDEWSKALLERGPGEWECLSWPEEQMVLVVPPVRNISQNPLALVSNARTGAWCNFTGWDIKCMALMNGRMYFGSTDGRVVVAMVSGLDEGRPYTATYVPLFDSMRNLSAIKIGKMGRASYRANAEGGTSLELLTDFQAPPIIHPPPFLPLEVSEWGVSVWGEFLWGDNRLLHLSRNWESVGGSGDWLSMCFRATSGDQATSSLEIVALELTYTTAEIVT